MVEAGLQLFDIAFVKNADTAAAQNHLFFDFSHGIIDRLFGRAVPGAQIIKIFVEHGIGFFIAAVIGISEVADGKTVFLTGFQLRQNFIIQIPLFAFGFHEIGCVTMVGGVQTD